MKSSTFKITFVAILISLFSLAQTVNIKSVKIGSQVWMKENLNVDKFQNGDPIPEFKSREDWAKANDNKTPGYFYSKNQIQKTRENVVRFIIGGP